MTGCDLLVGLDGMPTRQQAFPFDLPANPLGLTASNGIVVTPGIR